MSKSGKPLLEEILSSSPKSGQGVFWWLGQMGFAFRLGETTLLLDAYLSPSDHRNIPPLLDPIQLGQVDFILGTHDHSDHIDHPFWRAIAKASSHPRFVVPKLLLNRLSKELDIPHHRLIGLDEDETVTLGDITLRAIASAHEFLDTDPVTGLHPYLGYIISGNGVKIYHTGDSCIYDGMTAKLRAEGPFDVMFVPINGRDGERYRRNIIGNMTVQEAVDLVGTIKPGLAVPGHFEMFTGNPGDPAVFCDYLDAKYPGISVWVGEHGVPVPFGSSHT